MTRVFYLAATVSVCAIAITMSCAVSGAAPPAGTQAQTAPASAPASPDAAVDTALRNREYATALERIDALLNDATGPTREYLLYRAGLALLYSEKFEDATARFDQQLREFPDGPWADKAHFRKADAYVGLKQFDAAERFYAERVRALVGDARKAQVAATYIKFGDEYFKPADPLVQPDYAKAQNFYARALELEPGEALQDELRIKLADCARLLSQWAPAIEAYRNYLLAFDLAYRALRKERDAAGALPPAASASGKQIIRARLELGRCLLSSGAPAEARREWQDLLTFIAQTDPDRTTSRGAWIEATYLLSKTYGFPQPPDAESLTLGVQAFQPLIDTYPFETKAFEARFEIGQAYAHLGRYDEALAAYRALREKADAQLLSATKVSTDINKRAAELSQEALFAIGGLHFNRKQYDEAIKTWNDYTATYPSGPHWSDAQVSVVNADYRIGADAAEKEDFDAARQAWTAFLQKYPLDGRNPAIMYALGDLAYRKEIKREKAGEKPDWTQALADWRALVGKFPQSEEAGQAQLMIGHVIEEKVLDLDAALAEYRKLTWSQHAPKAAERVNEMNATRLAARTERVFRTNEPAKVRVDVRNIDKLTVKLYRVDLRDYFRKRQKTGGVEELDLFLIDPDKTIEVPVNGYARYKPCTQELEIPFDGPGVWAVNLSNEASSLTDAAGNPREKIEATALLVRSDIDVVLKSSRRQVLVFAQDMVKHAPAAGVAVLVSDGSKVVLEGKTGDDGVWLGKSKELKDYASIAVLAERDGHIAGNALAMEGLEFSTGLQPRGYLYTDRPVYRPGEAVNIRGILREVKDGQYTVPTQPDDERLRWKLDVADAKGRVLRTEELRLSEYGSFATQYRIAQDGPVGEYKLIARRPDGPTFAGAFSVQTYELPKAILEFKLDEPVVLRGQKIKGAIVLKYPYGEPVIDKAVEYTVTDARRNDTVRHTAITDKEGRIPLELDSTPFAEETVAVLHARQADFAVEAEARVWVAVRAFRAEVKTPRPLYLSEESVEATVETKDLKGQPCEQAMTVTALKVTRDRDTWAQTKVESAEVRTEKDTGRGRAAFKLTEGGEYILRAEGKDRFDHVVTAETRVRISDDKDSTRVRLFSDRQHYKVGDTIDLDVHSRLTPEDGVKDKCLALITYEGEEIIGYRTMPLDRGHNPLKLAVEHAHFPNFVVGVAVMGSGKFHTADRAFTVERELRVAVTTDRKTYRPRDEMTVEFAVTDQQGKPVRAEVGLAMIDQALLARYPDTAPNIVAFFQEGAQRHAALRTQTSCTFQYTAQTRGMVTEVLAEARRIEELGQHLATLGYVAREGQAVSGPASEELLRKLKSEGVSDEDAKALVDKTIGSAFRRSNAPASSTPQPAAQQAIPFTSLQAGDALAQTAGRPQGEVSAMKYSDAYNAVFDIDKLVAHGGAGHAGALNVNGVFDSVTRIPVQHGEANLVVKARPEDVAAIQELINRLDEAKNLPQRASITAQGAAGIDKQLNDLKKNAPPRTLFLEVAYWNPRITTDEQGKATVKVVMPDSSTTWKLIARGVTPQTLCGQADAEVVSKHDFFAEVVTPPILTEGDRFQPRATVHCLAKYEGKVDVDLVVTRKGQQKSTTQDVLARQTKTIDVPAAGAYDVEFDAITPPQAGELLLELTARTQSQVPDAARALADAASRTVTVQPWGMRIETHAAGVGKDTDFVEVELPPPGEAGPYHDLRMTVAVGPNMPRWLIEEALESGPRWVLIESHLASSRIAPPRTHADTASSLLGCLYAADYVRATAATGADQSADVRLLSERAAGLIAQLLAAQNDKGGWTWCGHGDEPDAWTTSQVAWALGKARAEGHLMPDAAVQKLTAYLRQIFADTRPEQTELKAHVLHGLSWLETVDFGHANRLYRNRESLSSAGLAHLALVFAKLDRKAPAVDLLGELEKRARPMQFGVRTCRMIPNDSATASAYMGSELEVTALTLLAQLAVNPRATGISEMVDYLTGRARADGWQPHKARGAVVAALATYYAGGQRETAAYELVVRVNGREVGKLTAADPGSFRLDLGEGELATGKQRVDFTFKGRGEYAYAVNLSGFSKEYPKPPGRPDTRMWCNDRRVLPPPLELKGRVVAAGFSTAQRFDWFEATASQLPVGAVATVRSEVYRRDNRPNAAGDKDYVIVKEAIPAGFRLLQDSISGGFQAWDYADNVLTLYYGTRDPGQFTYRMVATTPGTYRLPPTIGRSLYRPEELIVNKSGQTLTVLPRGGQSTDERPLTPDELYNLGRLCFEDGQHEAATEHLKTFLAGKWLLNDEPHREAVHVLLQAALARDDWAGIVDYFEILKERYPDLVIPFEKIVKVADAYARTGQAERSYLVYRATADASFAREAKVAAALQAENRFLESVDFMADLWRAYSDTPQVESIYYALSQTVYAKAEQPQTVRPRPVAEAKDAAPRRTYVTRDELIRDAIGLLERFLSLYPESPIADEASYSLAAAYLDLDDFNTVLDRTARFIDLFPKSKWLDRYRYIQALAHFHLGHSDQARALAEQVAAATYRDEQGVERPSPNKWLALYIIGQIYHARGDTPKALEYYKMVREQFADAGETIADFERKFVELPEVTIFHPGKQGFLESDEWTKALRTRREVGGKPATAQDAAWHKHPFAQLEYRNVKSAVLQVYRVDLMKLALIEKDLTKITAVNLAGIRPIIEKSVTLGEGYDYVDRSQRIELEALAAGTDGAYLAICRGDDLFTSGLVLVTPLAVEVQEDLPQQRARVTVTDAITRGGVNDVHVKVIGTDMTTFVTGETDLRGLFVADGVQGFPTAVARDAAGHFAFYRSERAVALAAAPPQQEPMIERAAPAKGAKRGKADYRSNVNFDNRQIQGFNEANLQQLFQQEEKGVQVRKSK